MAQIFQCDVCDKVFKEKHQIKRHLNTHFPKAELKCSQQLSSKQSLKEHVQNDHSKIKSHKCQMCPAEFFHLKSYTNHVQNMHLEEKMHKCDICEIAFKTKNSLTIHTRVVHMAKNIFANSTLVQRRLGQLLISFAIAEHIQRRNPMLVSSANRSLQ